MKRRLFWFRCEFVRVNNNNNNNSPTCFFSPALLLLNEMPIAVPDFIWANMISIYPLCLKDNSPEMLSLFLAYLIFLKFANKSESRHPLSKVINNNNNKIIRFKILVLQNIPMDNLLHVGSVVMPRAIVGVASRKIPPHLGGVERRRVLHQLFDFLEFL